MRQNIQEYARHCDKCQSGTDKHEFRDPLAEVEDPSEPLQVTSVDINGPYCITPLKAPIFADLSRPFYKVGRRLPNSRYLGRNLREGLATQIVGTVVALP